jgi:hypothetical protein
MPAITYKSDNMTTQAANASSAAPTYGSDVYAGRKLRYQKVAFIIPKATNGTKPVTTDIISLCTVPKGAIVDPSLSTVWNELVHTACNLSIGDADTPTRYANALDVKAANALVTLSSGTLPAGQKTPFVNTAVTTVIATFASTVTLNDTADSKLIFNIAFWALG